MAKQATASQMETAVVDHAKLTDAELDAATRPKDAKITVPLDAAVDLDNLPELPDAGAVDHDAAAQAVDLQVSAQQRYEQDHQIVTIRIRRNLVRTKIGPTWYTFAKGEEREVPRWVADWLMEQGYL